MRGRRLVLGTAMMIAVATFIVVLPTRAAASGFEHHLHDRDLTITGAESLACTRCHAINKAGMLAARPDHASCSGTGCHDDLPTRFKRGEQRIINEPLRELCASCHPAAALAQPITAGLPVTYPPYVANDYALTIRHQNHRALACTSCHTGSARATRPHQRCVACHDGSGRPDRGPAMTACVGCHEPAGGKPMPPSLAEPRDTITATFSHPTHAARGGAGARCETCHAAIRETNDNNLPRPSAATCQVGGCHDGSKAFAITASCTRCHTAPPTGRYDVQRFLDVRFSHALPAHADAKLACATCHPVTPTGEIRVADHTPCAACHAAEFGARDPRICFACHNATEPWRRLVADRLPPARTEFGATLDHASHPGSCEACHALRASGSQLRPPRGHGACTTAGCHAIATGPEPRITACTACHALGLASDRAARRAAAPWSVRARFDHARHRVTPDGGAVACTRCHEDLTAANTSSLATPRKSTCAACHDGATAFKITGTGCTKCHPGAGR